jgi:hypothetical protein
MAAAETLAITRDIDDTVKDVNKRLEGVDHMVDGVDHKVGSVIQGESFSSPRIGSQPFTRIGVMETGLAIQYVANQVNDLNCS